MTAAMLLAEGVLPQTPEQWGFALSTLTLIGAGVAAVFRWATRSGDKRVTDLAESQGERIKAAERRETEANERADRREEIANRRMDTALQGMAQLTHIVGEQTATMRQLGDRVVSLDAKLAASVDETRKANGNVEALRADLRQYRTT